MDHTHGEPVQGKSPNLSLSWYMREIGTMWQIGVLAAERRAIFQGGCTQMFFYGRGCAASKITNKLELRVLDGHPLGSHPQFTKSLKITRNMPRFHVLTPICHNVPCGNLWDILNIQ